MKTHLVAALVLVPCLARADAETNAPATSAPSAPATAPELAGLTPEQQKQAEPILAAEAKKKTAIEENKSLQPMQKQVEISTLHRTTLLQIQALTAAPAAKPAPAKP